MIRLDDSDEGRAGLADAMARRAVRWAAAIRPNFADHEVLAAVMREICAGIGEGHTCIELAPFSERLGLSVETVRGSLLASGLVASAGSEEPLPIVIDEARRVYLHRYYDYERRLARALLRLQGTAPAGDALKSASTVRSPLSQEVDWQQIAAALALLRRLTIVSGGPGTGKTTAVVNLLARLLQTNAASRVVLAAPTGKAATRLLDAVSQHATGLPPEIRKCFPSSAFTIHRLLGAVPGGGFRHDADNPLALDILVVDEASMLDLALATRLVEAIPAHGRLILLGDKDQLSAVEAGAVFSELASDPSLSLPIITQLAALTGIAAEAIVAPACINPTPLRDCVVWFNRNYRFDENSGIGKVAGFIRSGDWMAARDWLERGADASVGWVKGGQSELDPATLALLCDGYREFFETVLDRRPGPEAALRAFGRFRVLCAVRGTGLGTTSVNRAIVSELKMRCGGSPAGLGLSDWFPGRPVMILRNDYVLGLFNGDVGVTLPDESGVLSVFFPDSEDGFRAFPPLRLPAHETAFAMTVHKSQGSEFESIALLLPARPLPVVTRELLYTAVTRARRRVDIVASSDALAAAVATPTRRHSGLLARLAELSIGRGPLANHGE